ncbi:MAG: hypothetical protein M1817_000152 [Caeruleum heppii]|nr:MAG: hypothetical protein M1817_000152 [Caeruleum heppii]
MPFHHHQHSASAQSPGAAGGIYQAAQTLGSIGAPTGNLRIATSTSTTPGEADSFFQSSGNTPSMGDGGQPRQLSSSAFSGSTSSHSTSAPPSAIHGQYQQYETPRKTVGSSRQPEELHLSPAGPQNASSTFHSVPSHIVPSERTASSSGGPNINLQQASPQVPNYSDPLSNSNPSGTLPGALLPGISGRPGPSSANTAPSTVPTLPQISTQQNQYTTPTRPGTINHAHSYSRSSPAGFDGQKYIPYSSTPETSKYASTPSQKYTPIQHQPGAASHSPLGLADIRPRADSGMSDGPTSANPFSYEDSRYTPSSSSYLAPWAIYAFDWCKWPVSPSNGIVGAGKVAVGSYLEDSHNFIQILDTHIVPQVNTDGSTSAPGACTVEFVKMAEATHSYPVTRVLWEPPSSQKQSTDLLATSGDHLRLWSLPANSQSPILNNTITRSSNNHEPAPYKLTPLALLSNSKSPEHTAPLTSLDWNTLSPSLIITSSIDTTCTIWDIPTLTAKTQLIAHDKEVFDVRFCANSVDVFVSCGADGSVRMFDLRSLDHSTIIYEPSEKSDKLASPGKVSPTRAQQTMSYAPPLLRVSASPHDAHLLATFSQDSSLIRILDVRQPGQALLELRGHSSSINCIEWSPSRRGMLASGADDSLVLVWDLLNQASNASISSAPPNGVQPGQAGAAGDVNRGPAAAWRCDYEVGNISWAPHSGLTSQGTDWLGVSGGRGIWGIKL